MMATKKKKSAMSTRARVLSKAKQVSRDMREVCELVWSGELDDAMQEVELACETLRALKMLLAVLEEEQCEQ